MRSAGKNITLKYEAHLVLYVTCGRPFFWDVQSYLGNLDNKILICVQDLDEICEEIASEDDKKDRTFLLKMSETIDTARLNKCEDIWFYEE